MKNKILSVLFVFTLCLSLFSCSAKDNDKKYSIVVITKSTSSDFFTNVERGVNSAATEYNVNIVFEGPTNEEDYASQNTMIDSAVRGGADAIVLSAIDYDENAGAVDRAVRAGVKVVTIDSGVASSGVSAFIGTNNYQAGRTVGEAAIAAAPDKDNICVALVNVSENAANGIERENGVRAVIDENANARIITSVNVDANTAQAAQAAEEIMHRYPEVNVIIGFNEMTTVGVGNAIHNLGVSERVAAVGFDSNVAAVGMLEAGELDALIVQNPFAMGYIGVKTANEIISGKKSEENIETATSTLTKENMYDEENQKILFRPD